MKQYKNQNGKYSFNPKTLFGNKIINDTIQYQQKYNFEIGENNSTWNNEADAFKHSYMQAILTLRGNEHLAKALGDSHEKDGTLRGQPKGESNMDCWNNQQGRQIANEIIEEYGIQVKLYPNKKLSDIVAEKIIEKMKNGELITNPNDTRQYTEYKPFTPTEISKMTPEEFKKNEIKIMNELKKGQIRYEVAKEDWANFKNPQSGENMVYTREDIAKMSANEYTKNEKEINAQLKTIGVPYNRDLPKNIQTYGKLKTYKNNSATSSEGRWITINGNHVLIKD